MISQKVVFKFFYFLCIMMGCVMIHLHTKNHFGDCIIWRGASYLVFKKSCFFDVPLDHKVYTAMLHTPDARTSMTNWLLMLAPMSQPSPIK